MTVELRDLGTAFRKAKVDLYYSTNPSLFAISDYEANLEENLQRLREKINGRSTTWVKDSDFLGTWALAQKTIKCPKGNDAGVIHFSSEEEWAGKRQAEGQWIRVKSGDHYCCFKGEIVALALRQFQSCHRSQGKSFKPVPDGLAVDNSRNRTALAKGAA